MRAPSTVGDLVEKVLRRSGVDRVYGTPLDGLDVVPCAPEISTVVALAHRRVTGRRAAVHLGDGILDLPASPRSGAPDASVVVDSTEGAIDLAPRIDAEGGGHLRVSLRIDPARPIDAASVPAMPPATSWSEPDDATVEALRNGAAPVVLVGPGVVAAGAVPGLHALAAAASLGVLNTWGAKGVFDWRSRHHLATVGLQRLDFPLGGLDDADPIVASGVDPLEADPELWPSDRALHVEPAGLGPLAEHAGRPAVPIEFPPLRAGLARVTQDGWAREEAPLPPSRVTRHYSTALGRGSLVAADPGEAGYWVARTYGTTELGGVVVPPWPEAEGFAAACVLVARLQDPHRPALAVCDGPIGPTTAAVLEEGRRRGVPVPVEVWAPDGDHVDAAAHAERLAAVVCADRPDPVALGVDRGQLDQMIEVAGEVTAWGGSGGG